MATYTSTSTRSPIALMQSILVTGLVISVLGGLDYMIFFNLTLHFSPEAVLQYIASGLLGRAAFAGGWNTALLGLLIHFVISFVVAGVFLYAATFIPLLRRAAFVSALVYGAAVNLFMSALILPLSAAPKMQVTALLVIHGLIADAVFVGIPLAVVLWRESRAQQANG